MKGGVMVTQSEIDEGMLNHVVESLLGKIRTNLDISMQVLEAVRNEQSVQLRNTMQENQNKSMSSLSATGQPQMIWTELIQLFCMLSPEDFIREVRKILPYEQEQIIQVLQELEKRLDGAPKN